MAWEDVGTIAPMTAGAAITVNRCVKVGTTDNQVVVCAAITDIPLGVAKQASTASGQGIPIQINGVTRVEAGAAVTKGQQVGTDTVGRAITAVSTAGILGLALEDAAGAGVIISVALGSYAVKA